MAPNYVFDLSNNSPAVQRARLSAETHPQISECGCVCVLRLLDNLGAVAGALGR